MQLAAAIVYRNDDRGGGTAERSRGLGGRECTRPSQSYFVAQSLGQAENDTSYVTLASRVHLSEGSNLFLKPTSQQTWTDVEEEPLPGENVKVIAFKLLTLYRHCYL